MKVLFIALICAFVTLLGLGVYALCKIAGKSDYEIGEELKWKD